jgi:hypothetical protein
MSKRCLSLLLSTFLVLVVGCSKKEETPPPAPPPPAEPAPLPPPPAGVTAGSINLGKSIDAEKRVAASMDTFAKGDTIYVTIDTTGTGTATLKAKWTYEKGGKTTDVKEDSQTITPTGPATTEFHVSKAGGWPAGTYHVEVMLDDKPIGTKDFTVK